MAEFDYLLLLGLQEAAMESNQRECFYFRSCGQLTSCSG